MSLKPVWWSCPHCVSHDGEPKRSYLNKATAKRIKRQLYGKSLSVYRCPGDPTTFHVGHIGWPVRQGTKPRREYHDARRERRKEVQGRG